MDPFISEKGVGTRVVADDRSRIAVADRLEPRCAKDRVAARSSKR